MWHLAIHIILEIKYPLSCITRKLQVTNGFSDHIEERDRRLSCFIGSWSFEEDGNPKCYSISNEPDLQQIQSQLRSTAEDPPKSITGPSPGLNSMRPIHTGTLEYIM